MSRRGQARRAIPYLVLAVGGFVLAYAVVAIFVFPSALIANDRQVPNVVGSSIADASRKLSEAGFTPARGESRYHSSAPVDVVLGQTPVPGSVETQGARVVLDVSLGQQQALVPRIVGLALADAELRLQNAGLGVGEVSEEQNPAPRGQVLGSQPAVGARAPTGSSVDLTVSRGPASVEVPDVIGLSVTQARSLLLKLDLVVDHIALDSASDTPANTVVTQSPGSGSSVPPGTAISLTISGRGLP